MSREKDGNRKSDKTPPALTPKEKKAVKAEKRHEKQLREHGRTL